jgi:SnoaL-like domain
MAAADTNSAAAVNQATIERFYAAFAQLDHATMQACYAPGAHFQDEAFDLNGPEEIGGMWRMLCQATMAKGRADWKLDASQIEATATTGSAHWDAHYRFSATNRLVLNRIDATFEFDDQGLITRHHDRFNFWSWSRQALGTPGLLLGWTPFLRAKVKTQAAANLQRFLSKR